MPYAGVSAHPPARQTWHNRKEPEHAAYPAQMLKLRRTQEFQLPRCLQQLANEAGGRPGPTSSSGRAVDHRRQARASFVLVGRAPDVP